MPGIIGCTKKSGNIKELKNASQAISYGYPGSQIFEDNDVLNSTLNYKAFSQIHKAKENIQCWIFGEIYNIQSLSNEKKLTAQEFFIKAYKEHNLIQKLSKLNGIFCAVLYDSLEKKILLFSDRLGISPLYYSTDNSNLFWSTEPKGFAFFDKANLSIKQSSIDCFLKIGQLLGNQTFFENILRLPPSTLLTYSITSNKLVSKEYYWTWSEIKPSNISFKEAVHELGSRLDQAVLKQYSEIDNPSVSLSGGLDSRLIAGSFYKNKIPFNTYSFGRIHSGEVRTAKSVADYCKVDHKVFEVNEKNWFKGRMESIWKNDSQLSFNHSHAEQHHKSISEITNISYNGIGGDIILGGGKINNLDQQISKRQANRYFQELEFLSPTKDPFYSIDKEDPYIINNRLRRFTGSGIFEIKEFPTRAPIFDNAVLELIYSLPDKYRKNRKLYLATLIHSYGSIYTKIPNLSTGFTLSNLDSEKFIRKKIIRKLKSVVRKTKFEECFKYPSWMNLIKKDITKVLGDSRAIFPDYYILNIKSVDNVDFKKADQFNLIQNLFTLEIYFQQIFNGRFQTTESFIEFVKA